MRGSLMRLCTTADHITILSLHTDNIKAAHVYSNKIHKPVSPQLVSYWRKVFIDSKGNQPKLDNNLKTGRRLRVPSPDDDIGKLPDLGKVYKCILHIPDQHMPYQHPDMFRFLSAIKKAFPIDLVVNAGDEGDYHALSFHDSDPDLDSAGVELTHLRETISVLEKLFPVQLICNSNHGSMVYRKAKHTGIPVQAIKSYREILNVGMGFSWADEWTVKTPQGDVMFKHQSSNPVAEAAHERVNLLVGHNHSKFCIEYAESTGHTYWGATGGCLIDNQSMAFAYGKNFAKKPIIGCTIILEGIPMLIPMHRNEHNRWIGKL